MTDIVLYTSTLSGGGAEMQVVRLANAFEHETFLTHVVVDRPGGKYEDFLVSRNTRLRFLHAKNFALCVLRLWRLLRKEKPAMICSFLDRQSCAALLASRFLYPRPKVVVAVQAPLLSHVSRQPNFKKRLLLAMTKFLYPHADHVVAISKGVATELGELMPALGQKTSVIYNAGIPNTLAHDASMTSADPTLNQSAPIVVACGRLVEQKGFTDLIVAMAEVLKKTPATLWIIGEGKIRPTLEKLIASLSLGGHVQLLGFKKNPASYMKQADVFVLSSLFEGFGNVIVEAMAVGVPVIATQCPFGPDEIIEDGVNGLLVPVADPIALAETICRLLGDKPLRQKLAQQGLLRAQDFAPAEIARQYSKLFQRILKE